MSRQEDFIQAGIDYRMKNGKPMCIAGSNLADVERDLNRVFPFEAGAEYGYQYAQTHPNWISVEERLPEERKVVWVRKHFNKEVLGEFDIYDSAAFCNGEFQCDNSGNVTHWMPIVPPRKEE